MTIIKRKMPQFETLKPDSTASLTIPLGMSIHGILMRLSATGVGATFTRENIPRVRAILNGKNFIRDIPASVLHRDNLFRGSKDAANFLYLDFEEPRSKTLEDQYSTVIHTAEGVNSFKIELDIDEDAVGTLKIDTWAFMAATGAPLGPIPAFIREGANASNTGVMEVSPLFKVGKDGPGHILRCVHIFPIIDGEEVEPSDVLGPQGITLRKSGIAVIDRMQDDVNRFFQEHYEDVPIDTASTIDFVEDNNTLVNLMPTADATDMVWEVDIATPCKLDFYYRMVTALERL